MGLVIWEAGIAAVELLIAVLLVQTMMWLRRERRRLRSAAYRVRRAVREASELVAEPGPAEAEGRHAAPIPIGRHAASPPNDLGSYAGFDLNGWHPGTGA